MKKQEGGSTAAAVVPVVAWPPAVGPPVTVASGPVVGPAMATVAGPPFVAAVTPLVAVGPNRHH